VGIYEVFVDCGSWVDGILLLAMLITFTFFGIVERDDVELMRDFLPKS